MEDHTIVSLAAIAAGVAILLGELATGHFDPLVTPLAGAALGAGIGIPIGATALAKKVE